MNRRLVVLSVALMSGGAMSAEPGTGSTAARRAELAKAKAQIDQGSRPQWAKIRPPPSSEPQPGTMWRPVQAPLLPRQWPPLGDLVVELYALGHRLSLHDGAEVAAPWGTAIIQVDGVVTLNEPGKFQVLGVQGVKPVARGVFEELEAAERLLAEAVRARQLPTGDAAAVRKGYCGWLGNNGVIAARLAQRHATFFAWLGCGK